MNKYSKYFLQCRKHDDKVDPKVLTLEFREAAWLFVSYLYHEGNILSQQSLMKFKELLNIDI